MPRTRTNKDYHMARIAPKMYAWATKLAMRQNKSITQKINEMLEDSVRLQTQENLK